MTLLIAIASYLFSAQALAFGGDTDRGSRIYQQRCAMCHGSDGRGNDGMAVDFREEWHVLNKSDEELLRHIRDDFRSSGSRYKSGACPSQMIDDRDLYEVLDYMRDEFTR
ncbi:c-type cytochrome [Thiohalomonas denitrificans]|uniref:c-type cytochrome n=1 Tax=Thiohalomonas denitrificans TaxID=415747 RepID=UPI0026ECE57C|nr:c-type cytochrome [Thiohalomonas denitrificans]